MAWYIPLLIFVARIGDVSIGTVRTMLVISGHKLVSTVLGFVEVAIWVLAVGGTLKYLSYPVAVIAYAGGFATGVLIGMMIEERLALGYRVVRVICAKSDNELAPALRERGHRVTTVEGHGRTGPVEIAFMVVRRRVVPTVLDTVRQLAPKSYITVERVDPPHVNGAADSRFGIRPWRRLIPMRK